MKNEILSDSLYYVDFSKGEIIFDQKLYSDTVIVNYKLLNPNISFSKRDTSIFIPSIDKEPFFLESYTKKTTLIYKQVVQLKEDFQVETIKIFQ